MYFLKKFTSFGRNTNVEGSASGNPTSCDSLCSSETGMDRENAEIVMDNETDEVDIERQSSSASSLSIPDCFFDEVPETPSSDNAETTSSGDTDSQEDGTTAQTFRDNVESSTYESLSVIDETPQKSKVDCELDFRVEENKSVSNEEVDEIGEECTVLEEEAKDKTENLENSQCEGKSDGAVSNTEKALCEVPDYVLALNADYDGFLGEAKSSQLINDDVHNYNYSFDIDDEDSGMNLTVDEEEMRILWETLGDKDIAEARLAARRQARVEAREIRLRELERQQKEQEENADRAFDMSYVGDTILRTGRVTPSGSALNARDRSMATANSYHSSRRSSEDSIEEGLTLRDIRHELKEAEEKFKKAMIANAQLDNEKSAFAYQVELLKDRFEDLEETHAQLTREHRDKCREHEQLKRAAVKLKEDLEFYKINLLERDRLIAEYGLVIVDADEDSEGKPARTLVSAQSAELLQQAGSGSLDVRLKKFSEERNELLDEIRHLKLELEEERSKRIPDNKAGYGSLTNGPLDEETSKILSDYKFKLQKAEQDVSTLQANVARLESQVIRYKTAAESSEKAEDELKIEKRKLQRENRESIARIEELETANSHLQRRMDKLKNAKSTLLKEL